MFCPENPIHVTRGPRGPQGLQVAHCVGQSGCMENVHARSQSAASRRLSWRCTDLWQYGRSDMQKPDLRDHSPPIFFNCDGKNSTDAVFSYMKSLCWSLYLTCPIVGLEEEMEMCFFPSHTKWMCSWTSVWASLQTHYCLPPPRAAVTWAYSFAQCRCEEKEKLLFCLIMLKGEHVTNDHKPIFWASDQDHQRLRLWHDSCLTKRT